MYRNRPTRSRDRVTPDIGQHFYEATFIRIERSERDKERQKTCAGPILTNGRKSYETNVASEAATATIPETTQTQRAHKQF